MPLLLASIVSAAIVLGSPFMGQLQSLLRRSLSTQVYVWLFGVGVLVAVAAAIGYAVAQIRTRRARRLALIGAAVALGGSYMWLTATPSPDVNAVERVHFGEYGLIAFLFYRVWRRAGDLSAITLPLLAAFLVGTCDEWLQWFIPVRVGEARDVLLNLVSIACGLMFGAALLPPDGWSWRVPPHSQRRMAFAASFVWLVLATFFAQVHLGYENVVDGIGHFRSHYPVERLIELQKDRLHRWDAAPPLTLQRLSREDQYLDEGLWHLRQRNRAEPFEAWHENLILERFFAPVLDIPTYASREPSRWPFEQRKNLEGSLPLSSPLFQSTAEPYPIRSWPKSVFWTVTFVVAFLLAGIGLSARRVSASSPAAARRVAG